MLNRQEDCLDVHGRDTKLLEIFFSSQKVKSDSAICFVTCDDECTT